MLQLLPVARTHQSQECMVDSPQHVWVNVGGLQEHLFHRILRRLGWLRGDPGEHVQVVRIKLPEGLPCVVEAPTQELGVHRLVDIQLHGQEVLPQVVALLELRACTVCDALPRPRSTALATTRFPGGPTLLCLPSTAIAARLLGTGSIDHLRSFNHLLYFTQHVSHETLASSRLVRMQSSCQQLLVQAQQHDLFCAIWLGEA
mmetsp:Transcript_19416/g.48890  ORF Transcript_19416/g.48890 Transcript_19416/m.48890 type:complete len:202 (+) Transcript_19416:1616-2221(+)